ncbi:MULTISPECIES: hypothetical protein [Nostocales]|uniref:Uncharacterized protein n=3 Tax=Nostocales TaxID=1161 RepID=A0A0C1R6T7_9CYAN|nr:hypothetical protein [Tolypothrix bouteillei]KAF3887664.1 hypothetical protein DA73_0400020860 [Tolypothrix bouteillei VB521301]
MARGVAQKNCTNFFPQKMHKVNTRVHKGRSPLVREAIVVARQSLMEVSSHKRSPCMVPQATAAGVAQGSKVLIVSFLFMTNGCFIYTNLY